MSFFDEHSFFSTPFGGGGGASGSFACSSPPSSQFFEGANRHADDFTSPSFFSSSSSSLSSSQKGGRAGPSAHTSSSIEASHQGKASLPPLTCADGLLPVTVSMLQTAALEMQQSTGKKDGKLDENGKKKSTEREGEEEGERKGGGGGESKKFRIHGSDVGLVCLRGWVAPPGCQKLASLIRFRFSDGSSPQDIEVEYDRVFQAGEGEEDDEQSTCAGVILPSQQENLSSASKSPHTSAEEEGERKEEEEEGWSASRPQKEGVCLSSGQTRFLEVGSLVTIIGGISTDLDGVVSVSASVCRPIKNPLEFTLTHPAAVSYAAALFSARGQSSSSSLSGEALSTGGGKGEEDETVEAKLRQERSESGKAHVGPKYGGGGEEDDDTKGGADAAAKKLKTAEQEKEEGLEPLSEEEEYQLLVDYGHIEDPVQRQIILFLLTRGGEAKRTSRAKIVREGCACAGKPKCTPEQVEEALRELEESAEIVEHAGFIALAC